MKRGKKVFVSLALLSYLHWIQKIQKVFVSFGFSSRKVFVSFGSLKELEGFRIFYLLDLEGFRIFWTLLDLVQYLLDIIAAARPPAPRVRRPTGYDDDDDEGISVVHFGPRKAKSK